MSDLDDFKATYFEECAELLTELEEQFHAIAAGDRSAERVNAAFRAIHSIKGGGGAFGFAALVGFAHAYETLLDCVRDGRVALAEPVAQLCLRANDIVADFVSAARDGTALRPDHGAEEKGQFEALTLGSDDSAAMTDFDIDFTPVRVMLDAEEADEDDAFGALPLPEDGGYWEIRFTPHPELYARANDPLLLFRELASLGEVEVRAALGELPALPDFDPFGAYCSWEISLRAPGVTAAQIAEVFEFVDGTCELVIAEAAAPRSPQQAAPPASEPASAPTPEPADLRVEAMSLLALAESLKADPSEAAPAAVVPMLLAPVLPPAPEPEPEDRRTGVEDRRTTLQSIRVDLDKVDRVVNMVGELVITQSMLTQQMDDMLRARYQELVRGLEVLAQTTRGLQDAVMAIRAQPVKTVFARMPRLVRELAQQTGKQLRLETAGEGTEIDKTIVEQLADPLTHMIRNSADHGIETPEVRRAAGKPEAGVIRLSAEQAGGSILIAVEDDGAGINRARVLDVARRRGILAPDQTLTDEQVDQLIFAPGFSTAAEVSDISGRGVGMDVVLSNIKRIGGSVHVRSHLGRGTRMTLKLPLTLAVLDVMLVKVAGYPYVIPLSSIIETMQCARSSFSRMPAGGLLLQLRGEYVQVIDLADRFGMPTEVAATGRFVVLCEAEAGMKVALIVDDIIGQQQVVIKSLEQNFRSVPGIAGGTILGDGNVALIVDVQGLKAEDGRRAA